MTRYPRNENRVWVAGIMHTSSALADDLRHLGLRSGDQVVVHSSLRSVGKVEGGAGAVVAALLEVLGPGGLLAVPTYTYWTRRFDPARDGSLTGLIAETARTWPGAVRSWHPTHSVAAVGAQAEQTCADHHLVGALGLGSPFDRIATGGGFVLLLGVGHATNSTVHVGETHADVPYLDIPFRADSFTGATVVAGGDEIAVPIKHPPAAVAPSASSNTSCAVEAPCVTAGLARR